MVALTEAGRELVDGLRTARLSWLAEALAAECTPSEIATVVEAMAILDRVLDQ